LVYSFKIKTINNKNPLRVPCAFAVQKQEDNRQDAKYAKILLFALNFYPPARAWSVLILNPSPRIRTNQQKHPLRVLSAFAFQKEKLTAKTPRPLRFSFPVISRQRLVCFNFGYSFKIKTNE
jgi:hypothetical protein